MPQYKIHLTVDPADLDEAVRLLACTGNTKGLCFMNWTPRKGMIQDAMTSSVFNLKDIETALMYTNGLRKDLENSNVPVIRAKIETSPFNKTEEPGQYWESHIPIAGGWNAPPRAMGWLFSRNIQKKNSWFTFRSNIKLPFDEHIDTYNHIVSDLVYGKFSLAGKPHHERVLYDSNRDHDKDWE